MNETRWMEPVKLQFIGVLHGDITSRSDAPKNYDESERVGVLEIYAEYQEGLDGIAPSCNSIPLYVPKYIKINR